MRQGLPRPPEAGQSFEEAADAIGELVRRGVLAEQAKYGRTTAEAAQQIQESQEREERARLRSKTTA